MRDAISGTWLFGLVAVFTVFFSAYLAISINYGNAFRLKNGVVALIEQGEGHNDLVQRNVENYLRNQGYRVYGSCNTGENVRPRGDGFLRSPNSINRHMYCVRCEKREYRIRSNHDGGDFVEFADESANFYLVTVFFRMDLPLFGNIFTFPVQGETRGVYQSVDECEDN